MSCLLQRIESWWSQLKKHKTRYVVDSRFQGLYGCCYNNSFYQLCVHYYNMHRPWNSHCLIKMRFISKQLAVHHYSFILCVQPRKCLLIVFSPIIKRSLLCSGMNIESDHHQVTVLAEYQMTLNRLYWSLIRSKQREYKS